VAAQSQKRHNLPRSLCESAKEGSDHASCAYGYLGLSVLAGLNRDRLFVLGPIIVGLLAGAFLGPAIVEH